MPPIIKTRTLESYTTFEYTSLVKFRDDETNQAFNLVSNHFYHRPISATEDAVYLYDDRNGSGIVDEGDKKVTIRRNLRAGELVPYPTAPQGSRLLDSFTLESAVNPLDPHIGKKLPEGYQAALQTLRKGNPLVVYFSDKGVLGKLDPKDIKIEQYAPPAQLVPQGGAGALRLGLFGYVVSFVTPEEINSPLGRAVDKLFREAREERENVIWMKSVWQGVGEGICSTIYNRPQEGSGSVEERVKFQPKLSRITQTKARASQVEEVPKIADPAKCQRAYVGPIATRFNGQKVGLTMAVGRDTSAPYLWHSGVWYDLQRALGLSNGNPLDVELRYYRDQAQGKGQADKTSRRIKYSGLHVDVGLGPSKLLFFDIPLQR